MIKRTLISSLAVALFATAANAQQDATGPAVASFVFGSRGSTYESPNNPGTDYTPIIHVNDELGYADLEYDPDRGYGYVVTNPSPPADAPDDRFGPFDDSPNDRNSWEDAPILDIYDSFIGFKNWTLPCNIDVIPALEGDFDAPCPAGAEVLDMAGGFPLDEPYEIEGGMFRVDVPNGAYRFVGVFGSPDNGHVHRVLVEDGGNNTVTDIGDHVVLVNNHDQSQWDGNAFALVGFPDPLDEIPDFADPIPGLPPIPSALDFFPPLPSFVSMDSDGRPLADDFGALPLEGDQIPDSPILNVTQGYISLHTLQGNSRGDPNGGNNVLFEIIPVEGGGNVDTCGDFDRDGDIDAADRTIQTVGWTGAMAPGTGGAVFTDGDCDADGDVDTADQTGLIGNWTGAMAGGLEDDGDVDLIYDPESGNVTLDASDAASGVVLSFVLGTGQDNMRSENFVQSADGSAGPFIDVGTNTDATAFQIGQTDPLGQGAGPTIDLGDILPAGMDQAGLSEYLTLAQYASALGAGGELDLIVVPEPSTLALILFGLVGLAMRRRK